MSDQNSGGAEFFAGLVIGGLVGAALALLLAPQSGEETRAQIRDKSLEFKDRAEEGVLEARQTGSSADSSAPRAGDPFARPGGRFAREGQRDFGKEQTERSRSFGKRQTERI